MNYIIWVRLLLPGVSYLNLHDGGERYIFRKLPKFYRSFWSNSWNVVVPEFRGEVSGFNFHTGPWHIWKEKIYWRNGGRILVNDKYSNNTQLLSALLVFLSQFPEMNGKIPKYVLRIDAKHKDNWKLIVNNLHLMTVLPGMETVWVLVRGSHLFQVVCTCFQILPPTCCHHVLQFILAIFAYQTRP